MRHLERTPQQVEKAKKALGRAKTYGQQDAVRLRIKHPDATVAELADMCEMTKDRYWGLLRRALSHV